MKWECVPQENWFTERSEQFPDFSSSPFFAGCAVDCGLHNADDPEGILQKTQMELVSQCEPRSTTTAMTEIATQPYGGRAALNHRDKEQE